MYARYCACGHDEIQHGRRGGRACRSETPDTCSCLGFRLARGAADRSVTRPISVRELITRTNRFKEA